MRHAHRNLLPIPAVSDVDRATPARQMVFLAQRAQFVPIEPSQSFADLLREYRRDAGMTQEQLAERASLSPRALRKLESGASRVPRRDTVVLLVRALGLQERERLLLQASVPRQQKEAKALLVYGDLLAARGEWEEACQRYRAALFILGRQSERLFEPSGARVLETTSHT